MSVSNSVRKSILTLSAVFSIAGSAWSQQHTEYIPPDELKKLSMQELADLEITTVSRRPEKLSEIASAVQVITTEDIRRSAATNIPEALRLLANLQVAQLDVRHWVISARGFNSVYSNKLLVMIDGRTVYSPLFAGVFWDVQSVPLEDVDRIEVISGPGGTIWGANAVNGVINIITKKAKDSQGGYLLLGGGLKTRAIPEFRFGDKIGKQWYYRGYGQYFNRDYSEFRENLSAREKWEFFQGGFRLDGELSEKDQVMLQGNFYYGERPVSPPSTADGQNLMGQWRHLFSERAETIIGIYADRTWRRDSLSGIGDQLITLDFDIHHNLVFDTHRMTFGAGYRRMKDETSNYTLVHGFIPKDRDLDLFSAFVQDEIALLDDKLKFTAGVKFQHNEFSGFEWQPSMRLAWLPWKSFMIWSAVSRAIRAPSRIDVDYFIPAYHVPSDEPSVAGGPDFTSEKLMAYEWGSRVQMPFGLILSLSTFYNKYDDLYSVENLPNTLQFQVKNGIRGNSYGAEVMVHVQPVRSWTIRGGYTYFEKTLKRKPESLALPITLTNLGRDADHQYRIHSMLNLPGNVQFDLVFRRMGELPASQFDQATPAYHELDARIGWQIGSVEIAVAGQNLLDRSHVEFQQVKIPRNFYGKIVWRFSNE